MDNVEQQVIDRLKQANNVLITVSANPSVDQLAACLGLTLILNKLGKHGTAVFSGDVPSTIEFLQPEKTIEKNTDSLQDFIIALDKSKADKLRYKVEDKVVKIFISPYRTSISEKDLNFSLGDFNVDVVMALGVKQQADLDQVITAHGRILHDATVISVNNTEGGSLGSINWLQTKSSSLSELVFELGVSLDKDVLDGQIATSLLTGIVAETNRFGNNKTSPRTMSVSAALMAAGANQQLVAAKLAPPPPPEPPKEQQPAKPPQNNPPKPAADGSLEVYHDEEEDEADENKSPAEDKDKPKDEALSQIQIDDDGTLHLKQQQQAKSDELPQDELSRVEPAANQPAAEPAPPDNRVKKDRQMLVGEPRPSDEPNAGAMDTPAADGGLMMQPPQLGGALTASTQPSATAASDSGVPMPLLNHSNPSADSVAAPQEALSDESVGSPPPAEQPNNATAEPPQLPASPTLDSARSAVHEAMASQPGAPPSVIPSRAMLPSEPAASAPLGSGPGTTSVGAPDPAAPGASAISTPNTLDMPLPPSLAQPSPAPPVPVNGNSAPPVPPPWVPTPPAPNSNPAQK